MKIKSNNQRIKANGNQREWKHEATVDKVCAKHASATAGQSLSGQKFFFKKIIIKKKERKRDEQNGDEGSEIQTS